MSAKNTLWLNNQNACLHSISTHLLSVIPLNDHDLRCFYLSIIFYGIAVSTYLTFPQQSYVQPTHNADLQGQYDAIRKPVHPWPKISQTVTQKRILNDQNQSQIEKQIPLTGIPEDNKWQCYQYVNEAPELSDRE
jgi:hypothetical protein